VIGYPQRNGELITCNAVIIAALPGGFFRIQLDGSCLATARPSGKMRLGRVSIVPGDSVVCEFAAGCFSAGRIVHRFTGEAPVIKPRHRRKGREGRVRREVDDAVLA
jgi:translation initiation factor IF-1